MQYFEDSVYVGYHNNYQVIKLVKFQLGETLSIYLDKILKVGLEI